MAASHKEGSSAVRLMGDGYEPHVDRHADRLIYSMPVDSGFVSLTFSFEIEDADLQVLLSDPYRRAVLEVVAHTVLQRSMIRGSPEVTQADFSSLLHWTLHGQPDALATRIAAVDRDHNTNVEHFVRAAMGRRVPAPAPGEAP